MGVFSSVEAVVEADGSRMTVGGALSLINEVLDEVLAEGDSELDADTRWALAWYEQFGFAKGPFGSAEVLSRAKNTSVGGVEEAGIVASSPGTVQLVSLDELDENWDPRSDARLTAWEVCHHLVRALTTQGEMAAAELLGWVNGSLAEGARDLAYRLYGLADRRGEAEIARSYNALVTSWPDLIRQTLDLDGPDSTDGQTTLTF